MPAMNQSIVPVFLFPASVPLEHAPAPPTECSPDTVIPTSVYSPPPYVPDAQRRKKRHETSLFRGVFDNARASSILWFTTTPITAGQFSGEWRSRASSP